MTKAEKLKILLAEFIMHVEPTTYSATGRSFLELNDDESDVAMILINLINKELDNDSK